MEGEFKDICIDGTESNYFHNWGKPIQSYICSSPHIAISFYDVDDKIDIAFGTIQNRDTKNIAAITVFGIEDFSIFNGSKENYSNYSATYFDEYGCQGHSVINIRENNDGLSNFEHFTHKIDNKSYHMSSPDAIRSVSVPFGRTVTIYEELD